MPTLKPISPDLLFTKNDKEDPRLGECVQLYNGNFESEYDIAVLGYPDDEGIAANGGRVGAHQAPQLIRQYLYKMTPHLQAQKMPPLLDLGDISPEATLAERHEQGRTLVGKVMSHQKKILSFGGGHDYGYADTAGFLDHHPQGVVLNFDAHLDVRPVHKGLNSGTPFYRMLTQYSQVDFLEVGIQNQCNSAHHLHWLRQQGAEALTLEEIRQSTLIDCLKKHLATKTGQALFISIDIDAFTSSEAPGCSQSWTSGLNYNEMEPCLAWLYHNFDVKGLGIYEVSPPLDQDNRTSKLAALLAHQFIFSQALK